LTYFCCCQKDSLWYREKQRRLDGVEEAYRRLNNEIDLLNILALLRQSKFISLFTLSDTQRHLIPSLHEYNVDPDANAKDEEHELIEGPYQDLGKLTSLAGFDPFSDNIDRVIWEEITRER